MLHRAFLRACVVQAAGFPARATEDLSLGEQRLGTLDERGTLGWTFAKRLDAEPNLEGFFTRTMWEVVEENTEIAFVEVMG
jgi:hypothetical protein